MNQAKWYKYRGWFWPFLILLMCLVQKPKLERFDSLEFWLLFAVFWFSSFLIRLECRRCIGEHTRLNDLKVQKLLQSGPYSMSRNPLYISNLLNVMSWLCLWSWPLFFGGMVTSVFYYSKVIREEEVYLSGEFGEEYAIYCQKTSRWFSFKNKIKFLGNKKSPYSSFVSDRWTWIWQLVLLLVFTAWRLSVF